jgi:hypothetical protein
MVEVTTLAARVPVAFRHAHVIATARVEAQPIEPLQYVKHSPAEPTSSLHLHEPSKMLGRINMKQDHSWIILHLFIGHASR